MYNGIGLTTTRGTGTSGHVQKNIAALRGPKRRTANNQPNPHEILRRKLKQDKAGTSAILAHENRRKVEVAVAELEEELSDRGYESTVIQTMTERLRQDLLSRSDDEEARALERDFDARNSTCSVIHNAQTYSAKEMQRLRNNKLRQVMKLKEDYVEGAAFQKIKPKNTQENEPQGSRPLQNNQPVASTPLSADVAEPPKLAPKSHTSSSSLSSSSRSRDAEEENAPICHTATQDPKVVNTGVKRGREEDSLSEDAKRIKTAALPHADENRNPEKSLDVQCVEVEQTHAAKPRSTDFEKDDVASSVGYPQGSPDLTHAPARIRPYIDHRGRSRSRSPRGYRYEQHASPRRTSESPYRRRGSRLRRQYDEYGSSPVRHHRARSPSYDRYEGRRYSLSDSDSDSYDDSSDSSRSSSPYYRRPLSPWRDERRRREWQRQRSITPPPRRRSPPSHRRRDSREQRHFSPRRRGEGNGRDTHRNDLRGRSNSPANRMSRRRRSYSRSPSPQRRRRYDQSPSSIRRDSHLAPRYRSITPKRNHEHAERGAAGRNRPGRRELHDSPRYDRRRRWERSRSPSPRGRYSSPRGDRRYGGSGQ